MKMCIPKLIKTTLSSIILLKYLTASFTLFKNLLNTFFRTVSIEFIAIPSSRWSGKVRWLFTWREITVKNICSTYTKLFYVGFYQWSFVFSYIIIKIIMPSTAVSLDDGKVLHMFLAVGL